MYTYLSSKSILSPLSRNIILAKPIQELTITKKRKFHIELLKTQPYIIEALSSTDRRDPVTSIPYSPEVTE